MSDFQSRLHRRAMGTMKACPGKSERVLWGLRWCSLCLTDNRGALRTQQIRQGPLDKEWDWEHTITTGGYNPPCISPLPLTVFQLFHLLFVSVVSVHLMALPHLRVFFPYSLSPSLPSHIISHSVFSPFPFSIPASSALWRRNWK